MLQCRPKEAEKFIIEDESFFAEETESTDEGGDGEDGGRCGSRACPKFGPPKIPVRENNVSKFRYMHARRPKGTRVFFRPVNGLERPPYVPADKGGCFKD